MQVLGNCPYSALLQRVANRYITTHRNAVELIVSILALRKREIIIVQTSLIGSILSNL